MKRMVMCGARLGGKTTVCFVQGDEKITLTTEKAAPPKASADGGPSFWKASGNLENPG
jgi:hypothetical protein